MSKKKIKAENGNKICGKIKIYIKKENTNGVLFPFTLHTSN